MVFLSFPYGYLLDPVDTCIQQNAGQISTILQIVLPKMAQGLLQSGAIFSSGPKAYEPCKTLVLIGQFLNVVQ